jgi:hypothetical protein
MAVPPSSAKRAPGENETEREQAMDSGGWNWAIIDILLPAILVIVLVWALLRNRASRRTIDESERGTRNAYDREEERRRSGDDGVA